MIWQYSKLHVHWTYRNKMIRKKYIFFKLLVTLLIALPLCIKKISIKYCLTESKFHFIVYEILQVTLMEDFKFCFRVIQVLWTICIFFFFGRNCSLSYQKCSPWEWDSELALLCEDLTSTEPRFCISFRENSRIILLKNIIDIGNFLTLLQ